MLYDTSSLRAFNKASGSPNQAYKWGRILCKHTAQQLRTKISSGVLLWTELTTSRRKKTLKTSVIQICMNHTRMCSHRNIHTLTQYLLTQCHLKTSVQYIQSLAFLWSNIWSCIRKKGVDFFSKQHRCMTQNHSYATPVHTHTFLRVNVKESPVTKGKGSVSSMFAGFASPASLAYATE